MRWRDYVTALPAEARERLIDGILLGFRHLHYALNAARAGKPAATVLAEVDSAYEALREVLQVLQPGYVHAGGNEPLQPPALAGRLSSPCPRALDVALEQGEQAMRAASDAVAADADVTVFQTHLMAALAALRSVSIDKNPR